MPDRKRDAEQHLQRQRHDAGFDGEQQEGEGGVDQRGDGRSHVAEARTTRQQVDVDAIAGRVGADRQADEKHQHAERRDRPGRVGKAISDGQRAADCFAGEKRDRPERSVADAERGFARAIRRVAQRIVFERLTRHPLVVLTALANDPLSCSHSLIFCFRLSAVSKPCARPPSGAPRGAQPPLLVRVAATSRCSVQFACTVMGHARRGYVK